MNYLSIFSGIESATGAWHALGWKPVGFSEIEKFPCAVLAHHYPDVPNFGDATKFKEWPDANVDVLVGGSPCQSYSIAGLRAGLDDPRGDLMLTYVAIARQYRPKIVVWENVPGVLSIDGGRAFGGLLGLLSGKRIEAPSGGWQSAGIVPGIDGAYGLAWRVLDSQFVRVDGFGRAVPQRRRRVFVVGYLGDWRRAAAVLLERESMCGNPPPRRQTGKGIATGASYGISADCLDRTGEGAGGTAGERSGLGIDEELAYSLRAKRAGAVAVGLIPEKTGALNAVAGNGYPGYPGQTVQDATVGFLIPSVANPLTARMAKGVNTTMDEGQTMVPSFAFKSSHFPRGKDGAPSEVAFALSADADKGDQDQLVAFSAKDHGNDAQFGVSPTLRGGNAVNGNGNGGVMPAIAFQFSQSGGRLDEVHATLDSNNGSRRHNGVISDWAVRRLTPRECERLQGFEDDFTQVPFRGKPAADGPRYKALGNTMSRNVMRWLAWRIEMVEKICAEL